jgi:hypothetical protein
MKRLGVFILIFLYGIALLRPAAPVLSYLYNYDYIASVLCINRDQPEMKCNGACHLKKMIAETEDQDREPGHELIRLADYPLAIPQVDVSEADAPLPRRQWHHHDFETNYPLNLPQVFRPPTYCV